MLLNEVLSLIFTFEFKISAVQNIRGGNIRGEKNHLRYKYSIHQTELGTTEKNPCYVIRGKKNQW